MSKGVEENVDYRACRGGGGDDLPSYARAEHRVWDETSYRYDFLGVRLVRRRTALERLAEGLREVVDGPG